MNTRTITRALSLALALVFAFSALVLPSAAAAGEKYEPYAQALSPIGVFIGTGSGFQLDRAPTRAEGIVLLIRLLGAENDALAMAGAQIPFTDVPDWVRGYVAYAYQHNLTTGTTATTFGTQNPMDAKMYLTFLLRALGYSDQNGDFAYRDAVGFAYRAGLMDAALYNELSLSAFLRGHVAVLSYNALLFEMKDSTVRLIEKLSGEGKIAQKSANAFLSAPVTLNGGAKTVEEIAQNVRSVVMLVTEAGQGSGVIISPDGTIVTNFHVIDGASSIKVYFEGGEVYTGAVLVQDYDIEVDLAVIKITKSGLPAAAIGDSAALAAGQHVVAIGSPKGWFNTVSDGIISRVTGVDIQTSAPISPGSSGGALFNMKGELVGITYAGDVSAQNIGFAIPINNLSLVSDKRGLTLSQFVAESAPPQAPANVRILSEPDSDSVVLTFSPTQDADYYYFYYSEDYETDIWYDTDENDRQLRYQYAAGGVVTFSDLTPGHVYEVWFTAVKNGRESGPSDYFSFMKRDTSQIGTRGCYAEAAYVPDFGQIYGYPTVYFDLFDHGSCYWYPGYAVEDADVESYIARLGQCGYAYNDVLSRQLSSPYQAAYTNSVMEQVLIMGWDETGDFFVLFSY